MFFDYKYNICITGNFKLRGDSITIPSLNIDELLLEIVFKFSMCLTYHTKTCKWAFDDIENDFFIQIVDFIGPFGVSKTLLTLILDMIQPSLRKNIIKHTSKLFGQFLVTLPIPFVFKGNIVCNGQLSLHAFQQPLHMCSEIFRISIRKETDKSRTYSGNSGIDNTSLSQSNNSNIPLHGDIGYTNIQLLTFIGLQKSLRYNSKQTKSGFLLTLNDLIQYVKRYSKFSDPWNSLITEWNNASMIYYSKILSLYAIKYKFSLNNTTRRQQQQVNFNPNTLFYKALQTNSFSSKQDITCVLDFTKLVSYVTSVLHIPLKCKLHVSHIEGQVSVYHVLHTLHSYLLKLVESEHDRGEGVEGGELDGDTHRDHPHDSQAKNSHGKGTGYTSANSVMSEEKIFHLSQVNKLIQKNFKLFQFVYQNLDFLSFRLLFALHSGINSSKYDTADVRSDKQKEKYQNSIQLILQHLTLQSNLNVHLPVLSNTIINNSNYYIPTQIYMNNNQQGHFALHFFHCYNTNLLSKFAFQKYISKYYDLHENVLSVNSTLSSNTPHKYYVPKDIRASDGKSVMTSMKIANNNNNNGNNGVASSAGAHARGGDWDALSLSSLLDIGIHQPHITLVLDGNDNGTGDSTGSTDVKIPKGTTLLNCQFHSEESDRLARGGKSTGDSSHGYCSLRALPGVKGLVKVPEIVLYGDIINLLRFLLSHFDDNKKKSDQASISTHANDGEDLDSYLEQLYDYLIHLMPFLSHQSKKHFIQVLYITRLACKYLLHDIISQSHYIFKCNINLNVKCLVSNASNIIVVMENYNYQNNAVECELNFHFIEYFRLIKKIHNEVTKYLEGYDEE